MKATREQITAGILAGGAGRRLGGVDKGWYVLDKRPLVEHTITRVQPQTAAVIISANRSLDRYRTLGWPVVSDEDATYRGPLAGIARLLQAASTPYVLIVPVDTPQLPANLAVHLAAALDTDIDLCVARCGGRRQPLHALVRRELAGGLTRAVAEGVSRVTDWQDALRIRVVDWPECDAFANINAPADARHLAPRR
ncbi:molybdopterin-guanine dinucleotide biosynthesis protein A [Salinisphaera dokdonensis CL-ES53]|uniref:Molybdenum cofactor guanylyltransferase n=1 Tax=Salinisphaera dokdonensis CL-ES53 TaxID=1304272 RepID=A0ABV2AYK1_9GAMM